VKNNLNLCREQPLPYVGSIEQLAPVRRGGLPGRQSQVSRSGSSGTGSGMAFSLLADMVLDLASLTFNGRSLCWRCVWTSCRTNRRLV